jgi:hypothetical protein
MPSTAPIDPELSLWLPTLGSGLVLVVFAREAGRLLAVLTREGSRSFVDLRWFDATIQLMGDLPPGSTVELECGPRRLRIEVPKLVQPPGQGADVLSLERATVPMTADPDGGVFDKSG